MVQLTVINFNHGMNRQRVIPAGIWNRNCLTREEYSEKMRTDQPIKAASARIFLLAAAFAMTLQIGLQLNFALQIYAIRWKNTSTVDIVKNPGKLCSSINRYFL